MVINLLSNGTCSGTEQTSRSGLAFKGTRIRREPVLFVSCSLSEPLGQGGRLGRYTIIDIQPCVPIVSCVSGCNGFTE